MNAKCRLQKKMASYQIISRINLVHHNRVLTRKILISEEKCLGGVLILNYCEYIRRGKETENDYVRISPADRRYRAGEETRTR